MLFLFLYILQAPRARRMNAETDKIMFVEMNEEMNVEINVKSA